MRHIPTTKKHIVLRKRYKEITFCVMYESANGGIVEKFNQGSQSKTDKQEVSEVIIHFTQELESNREAFDMLKATFKQKRAKNIKAITFIMPDKRVLQVNTDRFK